MNFQGIDRIYSRIASAIRERLVLVPARLSVPAWLVGTASTALILLFGSFIAGCTTTNWRLTATPMQDARTGHTATKLPDGTVLIVGGRNDTAGLATVERYNPSTNQWTQMPSMSMPRYGHTATLLSDGTVLVVGGLQQLNGKKGTDTTERFNPITNTWTRDKSMHVGRWLHEAVLLANDQVLVIGTGNTQSASDQRSVELFDKASDTWTHRASPTMAHTKGTASLLPNGTVVLAGGFEGEYDGSTVAMVAYSERYDPVADSWSELALLNESPYGQTASVMPDGSILLAGGRDTGQTYQSTLRYLPQLRTGMNYQSNLWQQAGDMLEARTDHTEDVLVDGTVLVTGGFQGCMDTHVKVQQCAKSLNTTEIFTPNPDSIVTGTWSTHDAMHDLRGNHTTTLIHPTPSSCAILAVGGWTWQFNAGQQALNTAEFLPVPCLYKKEPIRTHF